MTATSGVNGDERYSLQIEGLSAQQIKELRDILSAQPTCSISPESRSLRRRLEALLGLGNPVSATSLFCCFHTLSPLAYTAAGFVAKKVVDVLADLVKDYFLKHNVSSEAKVTIWGEDGTAMAVVTVDKSKTHPPT